MCRHLDRKIIVILSEIIIQNLTFGRKLINLSVVNMIVMIHSGLLGQDEMVF